MEKSDFNLIITSLQKRVDGCHEHLDNITTTADLESMNIKELVALSNFCRNEQSIMDKIVKEEFYHIVGMSKMSAIQMCKFISKMVEYLTFRSDIKTLAINLDSIRSLPKLPAISQFKLTALCDLTLTSQIRSKDDSEIDDETLLNTVDETYLDVVDQKSKDSEIPYSFFGSKIVIKKTNIKKAFDLFYKLWNTGNYDNFKNALNGNGSYLGIKWEKSNDVYIGIIKQDARKKELKDLLKQ